MNRIVITGGAGFIGSHVVERAVQEWPNAQIVVLDKMTYAADYRNLHDLLLTNRVQLVVGDICDFDLALRVLRGTDLMIHLAAESHVDSSFGNSRLFTQTNVHGSHTLMEACRQEKVSRIVHVSTDEVYGEVLTGAVDETSHLNPTNPYSASKAAAEMIVSGYLHSFHLPVVTLRGNNVFGPRQFPEKLIPCCCMSLIDGRRIPIHGTGENSRHFLAATDMAEAIITLVHKGENGEVYNVGSNEEFANLEVARMICDQFGVDLADAVEFVPDRPFNDRRYAITWDKLEGLGWKPQRRFKEELPLVVQWYRDNAERYHSASTS